MTDTLALICDHKRSRVAALSAAHSLVEREAAAHAAPPARGFISALHAAHAQDRVGLIAEVKKASPSKGLIRADFVPADIARAYAAGGATCLSVLTEERWFQGGDAYLVEARAACALPVLAKDFFVTRWQIANARAIGADCILLIMAALSDAEAIDLEAYAHDLGLDVLVEVHDAGERDRALALKTPLLGINNRNLKTLAVDLQTSFDLAATMPAGAARTLVAESGLSGPAELAALRAAGIRTFLVGESLMRQPDITAATRALLA
ncbi:indole-3-glycerol phosphate synthase TrpC [Polymorphobacter sp.]|uniref:indole-3-glycerol phosphate synthase TrpC n=1 Tax=Polymorphobacter sp. TaxID=1909290 RepID=UPI003F6E5F19